DNADGDFRSIEYAMRHRCGRLDLVPLIRESHREPPTNLTSVFGTLASQGSDSPAAMARSLVSANVRPLAMIFVCRRFQAIHCPAQRFGTVGGRCRCRIPRPTLSPRWSTRERR